MPMGENIRDEEQARVDGLRAVNRMLREQNRVLREALERIEMWGKCGCQREAKAALTATSQEGQ